MCETSSEITAPLLGEVLEGLPVEYTNTENTVSQDNGTLCAIKELYEGPKKCDCCKNWVEQYPQNTRETVEKTLDVKRHAILCRLQKAHGSTKKAVELHSIVIRSPLLKSVLGKVFAGYPGITTTLEELEFHAPFWEFFHCWQALKDAENAHEADELAHIRLLLDELTSQLGDVYGTAKDLVHHNVMTYDFLWSLFPPGALVYSRISDQDCLLEVQITEYDEETKCYYLECKYVEWDGDQFGWQGTLIKIPKFSGTQSIQDLEAYPLTLHKAPEDIKLRLLERGRSFVSLSNCQQKAYHGIIRAPKNEWLRALNQGSSFYTWHISERIMIDAKSFFSHAASSADLYPLDKTDLSSQPEGGLSDRLLMLCSPVVKAYALKSKQWGEVYVDGISNIKWDENAFDSLVLEEETKRLIKSFVSAQIKQSKSPEFDDIVEGKGQGMIMLLTGEPGIGKTLTAETVSEKAQRPLYMLSAGELGISSERVEKRLGEILDLAYRWNAVLLLDESDVFLERRTSDNLERNQLVSVFLRMLEYYRGILILTTNRLSAFDPAFQSRIHFTLHYQGLNQVSRRKVWSILLERAHAGPHFSEEHIDALAEEPLNGRQIKNAVKAAKLLAVADDVALNVDHIKTVLRVMGKTQIPSTSDS
ncbi:P-loop containing nucleoside triphosphate hydrolase protein [Xylaria cubensis]|nr:P-loop containing nucleoside triphosphate hydrolase protein [Xylaria cubensis]